LIGHHSYEAWLGLGKPTRYNKAREKVEEILAAPLVDPLPESISRELDEILLAAHKELADKDQLKFCPSTASCINPQTRPC
jgi:trimethylamine:corrinoid methyltransferase-like protein